MGFVDCAFDLLEEVPELFEQIRTDQDSVLQRKCYPALRICCGDRTASRRPGSVLLRRACSEDAAFQDELYCTLNLVFRVDFGERKNKGNSSAGSYQLQPDLLPNLKAACIILDNYQKIIT